MKRKEEFEEIEYEHRSVKELLTEMKDISELIVDLAYSAVIFDYEEMAEEVNHLEAVMDKLLYQIRVTAMLGARTVEDAEQLSGILQVASAAENISNAAGDVVELLNTKLNVRPFLPAMLQKGEERIRRIRILENSKMKNKRIEDLKIETETGNRIIAIRRGNSWLYGPEAETMLKANDSLIVRGVEDGFLQLKEFAEGNREVL